jgi:hypothetical protein
MLKTIGWRVTGSVDLLSDALSRTAYVPAGVAAMAMFVP